MGSGNENPLAALSPWGAIASVFLIQAFGLIALQAFRVFLNIGIHGSDDLLVFNESLGLLHRTLLPIWGLGWILVLLFFQTYMVQRARAFLASHDGFDLLGALRSPFEVVKLVAAGAFATAYLFFLAGRCPFPSRYISPWVSVAFAAVTWGISFLFARGIASVTEMNASVWGFLAGAAFLAVSLWYPETFYFTGLLGSGVLTIVLCAWLLGTSAVGEDSPTARTDPDG
jgi:hypothetical protein